MRMQEAYWPARLMRAKIFRGAESDCAEPGARCASQLTLDISI